MIPRKVDWLLTSKREELTKIMQDNGVYVQLPLLGSQNGVVTVFGSQMPTVERAVRQLNEMVGVFSVHRLTTLGSG